MDALTQVHVSTTLFFSPTKKLKISIEQKEASPTARERVAAVAAAMFVVVVGGGCGGLVVVVVVGGGCGGGGGGWWWLW
jgi:uncharacterized membrane protein